MLRTRPPVAQQDEKVRDADVAILIEIRRAGARAAAPSGEKREQILHADRPVARDVRRT